MGMYLKCITTHITQFILKGGGRGGTRWGCISIIGRDKEGGRTREGREEGGKDKKEGRKEGGGTRKGEGGKGGGRKGGKEWWSKGEGQGKGEGGREGGNGGGERECGWDLGHRRPALASHRCVAFRCRLLVACSRFRRVSAFLRYSWALSSPSSWALVAVGGVVVGGVGVDVVVLVGGVVPSYVVWAVRVFRWAARVFRWALVFFGGWWDVFVGGVWFSWALAVYMGGGRRFVPVGCRFVSGGVVFVGVGCFRGLRRSLFRDVASPRCC